MYDNMWLTVDHWKEGPPDPDPPAEYLAEIHFGFESYPCRIFAVVTWHVDNQWRSGDQTVFTEQIKRHARIRVDEEPWRVFEAVQKFKGKKHG